MKIRRHHIIRGIARAEPKDALWFCSADVLPIKSNVSRKALTDIGFVFRENIDSNYVLCGLPAGWVKKPNGIWHAVLEDQAGNTRAYVYLGMDGLDPIHVDFDARFSVRPHGDIFDERCKQVVEVRGSVGSAFTWLNTYYPGWRNPLAYWGEESNG